MEVEQRTFVGGANLLDIDTALQDDQYRMLINGRQRFGEVMPVASSIQQTGLPAGNYQGGTSVGNVAIVFISGLAYYQRYGETSWLPIGSFVMDAVADRVWTIAVPKSNYDYVRKRGDALNQPIILSTDFSISGNPAGVLVQDGLSQPWLIQFNATAQTFVARATKTFSDWANTSTTANDREYVPIGKQMFFLNQKLFIVASDGKSIYQSVTGRPLDFMLNVDFNGNKLAAESAGGATSVSFNFDSDVITCVRTVNLPDSFLYATGGNVRLITLDYTNTILGEPTYRQAAIIEAGIVNSESLVDALGDYVFVDNDGIKSFNATATLMVEGRNDPFSLSVAKLFEGRLQDASAAISHDNYAFFYCNTTLGNAILVYDQLREKWVSFDITEVNKIKQFFVVATGAVSVLYAVCDDSLWLMYGSTTARETAQLHMRAITPEDGKAEHKGQYVKPIFRGCTADGTLVITEYADEQLSERQTRDMAESVMAMTFPINFPISFSSKPNMINNTLLFNTGLGGKKLAYVIQWNTDAALRAVKIVTSEQDGDSASRQMI